MQAIVINWWAVLIAAVVSMVIGSIWFGPLFGKKWMEITGMANCSEEERKKMQKAAMPLYALQFVLSGLTSYILAHFIISSSAFFGMTGAKAGMICALWIWLGFIMPTIGGGAMWSGKPKKLAWSMFWINVSYNAVLYIVIGAILGGWR